MQPNSLSAGAKPLDRKVKLRRWARRFWRGLREWCDDAAYERYLRSSATRAAHNRLTAEEFYVEQLNRRYSRLNRCC
jgi:uncharacterized short protein YbdD (DUF466 family)